MKKSVLKMAIGVAEWAWVVIHVGGNELCACSYCEAIKRWYDS